MNKYSFVIPTYENMKLLKNCLSVLNYLELEPGISFEVKVVDDGSTCDTYNYIKEVNKNYPMEYIYLPRSENSSRARARNIGIRRASGNIVIFIDADILVKPDYLLQLNRFYKYNKDIAVVGTRKLLNEEIDQCYVENMSIFNEEVLNSYNVNNDFRHGIFSDISYNGSSMDSPFLYSLTCNLAVPKRRLEEVNGFDEDLKKWGIEDIEMVYRMHQKGLKILINTKNEVIHQFHGIVETGTVVSKEKRELDYNTSVFIKKHPGFMGLPEEILYSLFGNIATMYTYLEKEETGDSVTVNFSDISQYEEIQERIIELMGDGKPTIIVNDYIEDSDLDVWIQLLSDTRTKIRYYPYSKMLVSKVN